MKLYSDEYSPAARSLHERLTRKAEAEQVAREEAAARSEVLRSVDHSGPHRVVTRGPAFHGAMRHRHG